MKKNQGAKEDRHSGIISAANLPPDYAIVNPREFIKNFRASFLKRARDFNMMTLEQVATSIGIQAEELARIEKGEVDERDMMALQGLSDLYKLDYPGLLYLFKLLKQPNHEKTVKMAACHNQEIDEATMKELNDFISKLEDSIE